MCQHCQQHVNDALAKMENAMSVTVDLDGGKAKKNFMAGFFCFCANQLV